jgi:hypothetical protein
MNTAQFMPRASKELQASPEQYYKLQEIFDDIFDWQGTQVYLIYNLRNFFYLKYCLVKTLFARFIQEISSIW